MFIKPLTETLSLYSNTVKYQYLPLSTKLQLISFCTLLDVGKVDNQYVYDSLKEIDASILEDIKDIEIKSITHDELVEFVKRKSKHYEHLKHIVHIDSLSMLVEK